MTRSFHEVGDSASVLVESAMVTSVSASWLPSDSLSSPSGHVDTYPLYLHTLNGKFGQSIET